MENKYVVVLGGVRYGKTNNKIKQLIKTNDIVKIKPYLMAEITVQVGNINNDSFEIKDCSKRNFIGLKPNFTDITEILSIC